MGEMVDRVASALVLTAASSGSTGDALWHDMAEQAIRAMREPTEGMFMAGRIGDMRDCWALMIERALRD